MTHCTVADSVGNPSLSVPTLVSDISRERATVLPFTYIQRAALTPISSPCTNQQLLQCDGTKKDFQL